MSAEPLFLDKGLEFKEKRAGTLTRLSDNVDQWPQEIMQEAYKTLPFLSTFEVNVVLDKQDEERGYAFGSIEIRPRSSMPPSQRRQALDKVHIPLVVKDQSLYPMDIFIHGKRYCHLTEARVRAVLFRPEMFDIPAKPPPGVMFGNELVPPAVTGGWGNYGVKLGQDMGTGAPATNAADVSQNLVNNGMASMAPSSAPGTMPGTASSSMPNAQPMSAQLPSTEKLAAVPILPLLHGRVLERHVDRVKQAMLNPDLLASYARADEGVQAALLSAAQLTPTDPAKTAEALIRNIKPDVVQLKKLANGNVLVKWAAAEPYAPQQQEVPPQQAQQMAGPQQAEQLQQNGAVTAGPTAEVQQAMGEEESEIRPADQFGIWTVQDSGGSQLVGWVFPRIYTYDGQAMPTALFTNGGQYAMQELIAGKMLGKIVDLPKGPPQGYGAFFTTDSDRPRAFLPLQVVGTFTDPSGKVNYISQTDDGAKLTFYFSDAVKAPVTMGDQLIIPTGFHWLPLKAKVELISDPSLFTKTANRKWTGTVEIRGDHGVYSYSGPSVAKLASADTKFIDRSQAEFVGVLLGMAPGFTKTALDRANRGELVRVEGLRTPTPIHEKYASAKAQVVRELSELDPPIRNYFLVKEASILDDALTADKILGLGFINAENVATFVDMIPQLEDASSKLAELLLAVRLGLKEVPEVAVERMLIALEDVINGLRTLRHKEIRFKE
jgi:hypothetical protein